MSRRNREVIIIDDSTLIGHEEGWQDAPVWDAKFLAKVQAACRSLTTQDVEGLTTGLRLNPEEIAAQGEALAARLDALSAEHGSTSN